MTDAFQPGDWVRWSEVAMERMREGQWNEKQMFGYRPELAAAYEAEAFTIHRVIECGGDNVELDIANHPFFRYPTADAQFLVKISALELLAMEADRD